MVSVGVLFCGRCVAFLDHVQYCRVRPSQSMAKWAAMLISSELKVMTKIPQISPISVFCKIPGRPCLKWAIPKSRACMNTAAPIGIILTKRLSKYPLKIGSSSVDAWMASSKIQR